MAVSLKKLLFFFQKLAEITGSRAYERFSAAQIMKIAQTKPAAYANTEVGLFSLSI